MPLSSLQINLVFKRNYPVVTIFVLVVLLQITIQQGRSQPRRNGGAPASGRGARGWVRTNVSPSAAEVRGSQPPDFFLYIVIQNPAF